MEHNTQRFPNKPSPSTPSTPSTPAKQEEERRAEFHPEAWDVEYHAKSQVIVFKLYLNRPGGRAKSNRSTTWNTRGKVGGVSYGINAYRPDETLSRGESNVKVFDD